MIHFSCAKGGTVLLLSIKLLLCRVIIIILLKTAQHRSFFTSPVAACWTRILSSGLAVETKRKIIKKYLPPEDQEFSPPSFDQSGSPRKILGRGKQRIYKSLNDIGRLLCDVQYNEPVSRRELLCLNLNKDFKEALKGSSIEKWLFGSNLDKTSKETAKELEKSTEHLKVPKENYRQLQGNLKHPFLSRKGTQQSRHKLQLPDELPTYKTFSASDSEVGQSERQEKSPLVLEDGTPCGRLRYFLQRWKHFSSHKKILSYNNGVSIPLCDLPKQTFIPSEPQRSKKENKVILNLIKELVKGGTICPVSRKENQFTSNIFTVPKLRVDGSHGLVLNLKKCNHFVKTSHSKIEDYPTVAHLITANVFMVTIDLKNAYYLVPIKKSHKNI
nr:unnamed protein product [Callosobruchus analis]